MIDITSICDVQPHLPSDFSFWLPMFIQPLFIFVFKQFPIFCSAVKTVNLVKRVLNERFKDNKATKYSKFHTNFSYVQSDYQKADTSLLITKNNNSDNGRN